MNIGVKRLAGHIQGAAVYHIETEHQHKVRGWDKSILTKVNCEQYRYGNILRFPPAAGELPRALALRDLTEASPPAGVYVCFLRLSSLSFAFYDNIFVLSQPHTDFKT